METTKLIDFIPAILILISVMVIALVVIFKFGDKVFNQEYKTSNILLLVASFLFITILIVHLFKEQAWTADTLKVLIGALLGAGSTKLSEKKNTDGSSVDISGGTVGGDIAGHDINKNLQNIQEAISKIENSVIHQNNQIRQIAGGSSNSDFLINTIYERGDRITQPIAKIIEHWRKRGWSLKNFSSDYQGMDGIYLVFSRPMKGNKSELFYYHGSDTTGFIEPGY